jgi:hypothetical protein
VLAGGPQADDPEYAPEQQLEKFILQPGYRLELVPADPIIKEPTAGRQSLATR